MSESKTNQLEEQILSTLTKCLIKMSDCLLKTFKPESKDSLALFKQFCSALNVRRQWLKTLLGERCNPVQTAAQMKNWVNTPAVKELIQPSPLEKLANAPNPNHPIQPKDLQSGLVYKR